MNILILGAGQVGTTAAHHLAKEEANEVTIVDSDAAILRNLQDRLDVRTVVGHASFPAVLERAGARDADMIIALTNSDEINMIACQIAYTIFQTPTKIARIRAAEYIAAEELWKQAAIPVDFLYQPGRTRHASISSSLFITPALSRFSSSPNGAVRLVGARAHRGGLLVGQQIKTFHEHIPGIETRIAAIYRNGQSIVPEGNTLIQENDEVFFIAARKDIRVVMSEMRKLEDPVRRVVIAGGGNIGFRLASALEQTNQVKVIDHNKARARHISELLSKTIVLHGDAADEELLLEENVDNADIFVALTNAEEANISVGNGRQATRLQESHGVD